MNQANPIISLLLILWLTVSAPAVAQDIEPRRWTQLPTNLSVVAAGYGNTAGDILFDPVLRIEQATMELHTFGLSYVHAFEWLGKSARLDLTIPHVQGRWAGLLEGQPASTRRHGFADPVVRFSINLYGAPPLQGQEYANYYAERKSHTVVGAAVAVFLPLGEYKEEKLINLGGNRFTFRPQIGVVHTRGSWAYELSGSAFLFEENDQFFPDNKLNQDPLYTLQAHIIKAIKPGMWVSLSAGYGWNGTNEINGAGSGDKKGNFLWALSLGLPINRQQSLKLSYINFNTQKVTGVEIGTYLLAWSYAWGR